MTYLRKYISNRAYSLCKLFMIVDVDFLNEIHIDMKLWINYGQEQL